MMPVLNPMYPYDPEGTMQILPDNDTTELRNNAGLGQSDHEWHMFPVRVSKQIDRECMFLIICFPRVVRAQPIMFRSGFFSRPRIDLHVAC